MSENGAQWINPWKKIPSLQTAVFNWTGDAVEQYGSVARFIDGKFSITQEYSPNNKTTLNLFNVSSEFHGIYICVNNSTISEIRTYDDLSTGSDNIQLYVKGKNIKEFGPFSQVVFICIYSLYYEKHL